MIFSKITKYKKYRYGSGLLNNLDSVEFIQSVKYGIEDLEKDHASVDEKRPLANVQNAPFCIKSYNTHLNYN